ncbi:MAG: 3-deoxy-D-manno-octulosonic acid transferase [Alphaproteobacteria bacterium]|nr:3-deoxy-D-manno-octulosonic acid transferase [Alphaproteobacteria bacterium]
MQILLKLCPNVYWLFVSLLLNAYSFACETLVPLGIGPYFRSRLRRGKEMPERLSERYGAPTIPRPEGARIVWIHGASVGESLASLPLIERLLEADPTLWILSTSGTVTSARLMAQRLPARAVHQFLPLDVPSWIEKFLSYWKPELGLWMESEVWPNTLLAAKKHNIPLVLMNARVSKTSQKRWQHVSGTFQEILSCFDMILTQTKDQENFFKTQGMTNVWTTGNIKFASAPLPYDALEKERLEKVLAGRPLWVAASTHEGEENLVAKAHLLIKEKVPSALCVIIPRHPNRAHDLCQMLSSYGTVARRSLQEDPSPTTDFYLGDTLGELGLFFRLSPHVFLGGSLVPIGGHNLIEPAQIGCALIHGPYMFKQEELTRHFEAARASHMVTSPTELAETIITLLTSYKQTHAAIEKAKNVAQEQKESFELTWQKISPYLRRFS